MIIKNKTIVVLGGDLRQVYLANELASNNNVIVVCNESKEFDLSIEHETYSKNLFEKADIVITPIPLTKDNQYINASFSDQKINIFKMMNILNRKNIFIGCKIPKIIRDDLKSKGIRFIDLFENEKFAIANAVPTAEGAIYVAMKNSSITISRSNCLVLGYGRCGKVLAEKLIGLGAFVSIESRRVEALKQINAKGYYGINYIDLNKKLGNYDYIFNTIPSLILNKERLQYVKKTCLIVDIASKPGGTDFDIAEKKGIKAILSLGLPGKIAPKTAAIIIKSCIECNNVIF